VGADDVSLLFACPLPEGLAVPRKTGRTTSPDDFNNLMNDLEHKIFSHLDDDTHVYPGHGDDTTLGTERPTFRSARARLVNIREGDNRARA
jgi:glyoxylase-like metal-dependent hydrolase (beta-lactamase superfamily II)